MAVPFQRLLVANRSEIAIRVFRAATELGIKTVAIYAEEDSFSLHRFKADEAYQIGRGKGPARRPISRSTRSSAVATEAKVDAIHPATASFPRARNSPRPAPRPGIVFIGPTPETMRTLGNKVAARNLADLGRRAGHAGDRAAAGRS